MPTSQSNEVTELLKSIEALMNLMQGLLGDIKEHSTSLIIVKEKLESLTQNVEILSHVVRGENGKGSMITRLALTEQSIYIIQKGFDELKAEVDKDIDELKRSFEKEKEAEKSEEELDKKFKREKLLAKLKIAAVTAPGVLALILVLIRMILGIDITD